MIVLFADLLMVDILDPEKYQNSKISVNISSYSTVC